VTAVKQHQTSPAGSGSADRRAIVDIGPNPVVMAGRRDVEPRVVDKPKESRYELWLGDTRAGFIDYLSEPGTVLLVHTEVDPALEGQGLGVRLVAGALADLRARGLKLVPLCPFVRAYLRRHPEDADLVGRGRAVSK
jgi:uncharacterized protein